MKHSLEGWLSELDAYAASHPDGAYAVYATQNLYLHIWTTRGGIPDPQYNPLCVPQLRGLYKAAGKINVRNMIAALNDRMATSYSSRGEQS